MQKVQNDNKSKADSSHSAIMMQMEGKFNQRIKELQEQHNSATGDQTAKVKQLEREKAQLVERLELASRDSKSEASNLAKKVER